MPDFAIAAAGSMFLGHAELLRQALIAQLCAGARRFQSGHPHEPDALRRRAQHGRSVGIIQTIAAPIMIQFQRTYERNSPRPEYTFYPR
jgi:hypothetical protein